MDGSEERIGRLEAILERLEQRVRGIQGWNDRLGSAVKAAWWARLLAFGLLVLLGIQEYRHWQPQPEVLSYVYIMDREGHIVERGVPGAYTITDYQAMNILEKWLKDCRGLVQHRDVMSDHWDRCQLTTKEQSEARNSINRYMDAAYTQFQRDKPEVEIRVTSRGGIALDRYRFEWVETTKLPNGRQGPQERMTGEFTVDLVPPTDLRTANKTWVGLRVTKIYWGPQTGTEGGS